jgi:hypothetical protein
MRAANENALAGHEVVSNFDFNKYTRNRRPGKSLGEICLRVLEQFSDCSVAVSECAKKIGVDVRRLYDVFNILETFGAVEKKKKYYEIWSLKSLKYKI